MNFEPIKKDSPSIEYLQMPKFIWEMDELSMNAKNIYMLIYNRIRQSAGKARFTAQDGRLFCYFNDDDLAKELRVSRITVIRAVNELKEAKLLIRERTSTRDGKSVTYLNGDFACITGETTKASLYHQRYNLSITDDTTKVSPVIQPFPYISKNNMSKNNRVREEEISSAPKQKKITKSEQITKAVIEHWNEAYGTKYSSTTKGTIKLVDALLKSGYQQDQILEVIDYRAKNRKTQADYKWFVPATVLALKNFDRSYQFMLNDQTKPHQGYKNRNKIPDSVTLPDWYEVKESEQATTDDVQKILELQNQILKGEQQ